MGVTSGLASRRPLFKGKNMAEQKLIVNESATPALAELKHSIMMHMRMHAGVSQQLAVFLIKVLDYVDELYEALRQESPKRDATLAKVNANMANLAYAIVESVGIFVQQSIDDRRNRAETLKQEFPSQVSRLGDEILIVIGKTRGLPDKISAKNAVLQVTANALRGLSGYTSAKYPSITDSNNVEL